MSTNSSKEKRDKKHRSENNRRNKQKSTRNKKPTEFEQFDYIINKEKEKQKKKNEKKRYADSSGEDNHNKESDESIAQEHRKNKKQKLNLKDDNNTNSSNASDDDSNETNKTSGSDEDSDNENDNDDIVDNVESSDTDSLSDSKKKKKRKVTSITKSVFTPFLKNQLQFYIRNALFQKVKIVDESHLETGGTIIKEVFERLKLDKSSSNINAYVNETRQIIKRVISSRRGYIKKKLQPNLKIQALLKSQEVTFEMLGSLNSCFKDGFEQDQNVRKVWYVFCYHFLPLINKEWKKCLVGTRLLKPTFLYDHITTSDQAMVLWFLKNLEPKMKLRKANNWPPTINNSVEGEQELRTGLKDYISYYNLILEFEAKEEGELAGRWSDIFWETMIVQHPKIYKNDMQEGEQYSGDKDSEEHESLVLLPGLDHAAKKPGRFGQRKSFRDFNAVNNDKVIASENDSNNVALSEERNSNNDIENGVDSMAEHDRTQTNPLQLFNQIFLDEVKNPTGI